MNKPFDVTGIEIKTKRLLLRPFRESDLQDFYEYAKVDGVGQMAGWQPHKSVEETKMILDDFIQKRKVFALEKDGKVIGSLGVEKYNESRFPELQPYQGRAIGYVLSKAYWGQGLMPEAVQAVKQYLFEQEKLDFVNAGHFAWNRQSARVIHKCGFQFLGAMPFETHVGTVEEDFEYICFHPKFDAAPVKLPKAGILCAAQDELAPFLPWMEIREETKKGLVTFHHGTLEGVNAVACWCGVGKVNAAIAAQLLADTYQCDFILNSGACGGMTDAWQELDTIISTEVAHHDMHPGILTEYHPYRNSIWFPADENLLKAARAAADHFPQHKVAFGRTATGEAFIDNSNRDGINKTLAPLSVDMETAAMAQVCHAFQTPFLAIRTITDTPAHDGDAAYQQNSEQAEKIAAYITRQTLVEWKKQQGK